MGDSFKAIRVAEKVWWVGAIDWSIRDFHGYSTPRGSTYNAYLIIADKITLIDTVKAPFAGELHARIGSVIDPKRIDYIVSNHSEMDHSGSLQEIIEKTCPERVYASRMGQKALFDHFDLEVEAVENGEALDLGGLTLSFLETRMIHWPDSMFAYIPEEKLLFSQDAFGMHLATTQRFADEIAEETLRRESDTYYANIVLPYSPVVGKTLAQVRESSLEIKTICPDHGPIWRGKGVGKVIGWYDEYVEQKPRKKTVILYDTMWHSTEKMARAIADGIGEVGAEVKILDARADGRAEVIAELLFAGAFVVGSPTLNRGIFPTLADRLTYVKGLQPKNLIGATFGSYGWGGEAPNQLKEMLEDMGVEIVAEPLKIKYVPTDDDLVECREFGKKIGVILMERIENAR